jgi:hypothetical protein
MAVRRARLMNWKQTEIKGHWDGGKDRFYQLPETAEETPAAEIAKPACLDGARIRIQSAALKSRDCPPKGPGHGDSGLLFWLRFFCASLDLAVPSCTSLG